MSSDSLSIVKIGVNMPFRVQSNFVMDSEAVVTMVKNFRRLFVATEWPG